jgi:excisionase family DNA binding protein
MSDEYTRGLEELRQRFSALPTADDQGPAHKSYVELGRRAANLVKGDPQAARAAGISQHVLDQGVPFGRWRAIVNQLHGPPTYYNPLGSVLVIDKLIAAARQADSVGKKAAAPAATSKAYLESRIRKKIEDARRQQRELSDAIIAGRKKNQQWIDLLNGPDAQEYRDLRKKIADITERAGGAHAACQDREVADKLYPLLHRQTELEEDYGCYDAPSVPLVIARLQQADAWLNAFLRSKLNNQTPDERKDSARETIAPIARMILYLCQNDNSLPSPPSPLDDPWFYLQSLQQWATQAHGGSAQLDKGADPNHSLAASVGASVTSPAGIGEAEIQKQLVADLQAGLLQQPEPWPDVTSVRQFHDLFIDKLVQYRADDGTIKTIKSGMSLESTALAAQSPESVMARFVRHLRVNIEGLRAANPRLPARPTECVDPFEEFRLICAWSSTALRIEESPVPQETAPDPGLTVTEAHKLTGLSTGVISRLANKGTIKSAGEGHQRRINRDSLEEYMLSRPAGDRQESNAEVERAFRKARS